MAFSKTFDTATPEAADTPEEADDRMREIKAAVQERANVDHYWPLTGTEVSNEDAGEHKKVTLRVGSAPSAVADKGFVYAKDVSGKAELFYIDEDGNEVQITSGGIIKLTSAALLNILANNTYLTAVDNAGTGTVDLIKAGTNDLPTLPDSAEMASSAAPVEDEAIANKKYVDDSLADTAALAKAWGVVSSIGTLAAGSFNVASVTHSAGTGEYVITWDTPFSTADYPVLPVPKDLGAIGVGTRIFANVSAQDTTTCTVHLTDVDGNVNIEEAFGFVAFGTQ